MATETEFQIAILAEGRHSDQGAEGAIKGIKGAIQEMKGTAGAFPIEWLICNKRDDRWLDFSDANGLVSAIDLENPIFDLPWLLGIVAIGDADAFGDIEERWSAVLPSTGVAFKRVAQGNSGELEGRPKSEDLLRAALECVAGHLAAQRRHAGRAALDLAVYRREFDRVQRSFSRLEEYVGRHIFQRPNEIFEYGPDLASARGSRLAPEAERITGSVSRSLTQILPVDSLGFSSFSLYAIAKPEGQEDALAVKLRAIETGKVYGEWSLRGGDAQFDASFDARAGWVELALGHAIDEAALSLVIHVEWPSAESGWGLALGPPHPYEEFCAEVEGGRRLRAPLSLRIFSGLPGVRVAATTTAIRPTGAPSLLASFIAYDAYAAVEQVLPLPAEGKPTLVSYDPEIGCLTVHPRVGGLSIARLKIKPPANAWRLSAQVHLAHELASPTDFGLLAGLPREELKDLAQLDRLDGSSASFSGASFSGWTKLAPLEARSISVVFAAPPEETLSVYLLTRQDPESSPDFGWARFSKIEFNLLRRSAAGQDSTNEAAPSEAPSPADELVGVGDEEAVTAGAE